MSTITSKPLYCCIGSSCAKKIALTPQGMCSGPLLRVSMMSGTRTLVLDEASVGSVCSGILLDRIGIWGVGKLGQHLRLFVMFHKPFLSSFHSVVGRIVLREELAAIREYCCLGDVCAWSAPIFKWVVLLKVRSTWRPGLRFSLQNLHIKDHSCSPQLM